MTAPLTAERLREVLDYDPDTGVFRWRVTRGGMRAGDVAGTVDKRDGRRTVHIEDRGYFAHRLAFLWMTGEWPAGVVDHRDGAAANNAWANLRHVTVGINNQNRVTPSRRNSTGLLGASRVSGADKGRYRAHIKLDGKQRHLGCFDTPEQAHAAYIIAKMRLHPGVVAERFGEAS